MTAIQDDEILALYFIVRDEEGAGVTGTQKIAIERLKRLARNGNKDATIALDRLTRVPDMHPLLREVLAL